MLTVTESSHVFEIVSFIVVHKEKGVSI